ncbi:hypothetical protein DR950_41920 [Kitasatospora xanthocidica]|uniref:DUF4913 domain-containing protein n=1 Tax=Kitasatospora xanthocidica TaxID=83382 RepID=A0A372ZHV7_9ACTN|nr:hypothetical protein [Kitasatospora xanthocidica]RGD55423.1 hypothetical protein DR950_41920 [Kitasatospora xanthocidica]
MAITPERPTGVKPGDGYMVVVMEQTKIKKRLIDLERQGLNDRLALLESQHLAENIYKLAKAMEADAKARLNAKSPCWNWVEMTEEEAGDAWATLLAWRRTVLKVRWPSVYWATTTRCWYLHPEVVEELSALYLAWKHTYTAPEATPMRAAEFLERWLPGALRRIPAYLEQCTQRSVGHQEYDYSMEAHREHDDEEISTFIQADLDARPSAPVEDDAE